MEPIDLTEDPLDFPPGGLFYTGRAAAPFAERPDLSAPGGIETGRVGGEGQIAVRGVAEERIGGEVPHRSFLPGDAADPVATGVPVEIGAGQIRRAARVAPDRRTVVPEGDDRVVA